MLLKPRANGRPTKRPSIEEFAPLYNTMTYREIAEHYGVALATVKTWVQRYKKEEKGEQ